MISSKLDAVRRQSEPYLTAGCFACWWRSPGLQAVKDLQAGEEALQKPTGAADHRLPTLTWTGWGAGDPDSEEEPEAIAQHERFVKAMRGGRWRRWRSWRRPARSSGRKAEGGGGVLRGALLPLALCLLRCCLLYDGTNSDLVLLRELVLSWTCRGT